MKTLRLSGLGVAGAILVLALAFQGTRGIWEPDEGRNVNIALGMLKSGDWLLPRLNGAPYLDKPPLHFWTVAAGMGLLGAGEWGARLLHGLLFAATAGLVGALGCRLWDRPTGRLGALVYATSLLPFIAGNVLTPDTPLAASAAALAYAYWRAETSAGRERSVWWLLAGLAAGLGLLAKGPALLVLLPPFAVHLVIRRRLGAALRSPGLWVGAVLALGLALSWYLPVALGHSGAGAYFLDNQVTGRLATSTYRRNPGWQGALEVYLPVLLLGTLPWSGWWVVSGRRLASGLDWRRIVGSPFGLLLLWATLPLVVYLLASSRLPFYLLPIFAPLALATARGIQRSAQDRRSRLPAGLALWCLVLLALKGWAGFTELGRDSRRVAGRIAAEAPHRPYELMVVDVHANGLALYGFGALRWVTLAPDPYPLFSPLPTLAQAAAGLAAESRPLVVVLAPRRQAQIQAVLAAAGFACVARPPVGRVALSLCHPAGR